MSAGALFESAFYFDLIVIALFRTSAFPAVLIRDIKFTVLVNSTR